MKLTPLLLLALFAGAALADPLGTYPNNGGGQTVLTDDAAGCGGGMRRAEARDEQGRLRQVGCYGVHNEVSVVILWAGKRVPATVVPVHLIRWLTEPAKPAQKAIET